MRFVNNKTYSGVKGYLCITVKGYLGIYALSVLFCDKSYNESLLTSLKKIFSKCKKIFLNHFLTIAF